jgi:NAD(P)-dependent dehydrogenase (short-subunit alcohol dehydrogenase family)
MERVWLRQTSNLMNMVASAARTVLITGGTGGVGLRVASALRARGDVIVLGSRDPARYAQASAALGADGVHPFIADILDQRQIKAELQRLNSTGIQPTDVIHAAAGGLEPVLRDLARLMTGIRNLHGTELEQAHAAARDELAALVAGTRDEAMTINYLAPARLLDLVVPSLPPGGSVTFYTSLWSSFFPHPQVPVYYEGIAESKHAMEHWLESRSEDWARRRITTAVISSTLVLDTRVGRVLDRFCGEPMPLADRERWRSTHVTCSDLVRATLEVLDCSGPGSAGGWVRRYLPAPGVVSDQLGADDSRMQYPVTLAQNAPRWAQEPTSTES